MLSLVTDSLIHFTLYLATYLDDLQLDSFIRLNTNKATTDGVNDSINELLLRVVRVGLLSSKLSIGNQFLLLSA